MNRILIPAVAWIPINKPAFHPDQFEVYERSRDQFINQLGEALQYLSKDIVEVGTSIHTPPAEIFEILSHRNLFNNAKFVEYIQIQAAVEIDLEELHRLNKGELEQEFVDATSAIHLSALLEQILVLSELALPGCISFDEGVAVNGMSCTIKAKRAFHDLRFPEGKGSVWPSLIELDLRSVVKWALGTSFADSALGKTRVERCLAAYTHVIALTQNSEGEVLFRAMQALEAFYSDGSGDLRKQLSDKSSIWLGPWPDRRNIVGHLYDSRSKFIHGASSLEYSFARSDPWEEDEKMMIDFHSSSTFAVRLLVATLQRCVERDVHELSWSYSLKTS